MEDPFHSTYVMPWKYLHALYIDKMRPQVSSWAEFSRLFGHTAKTVKAIRDEFGIHDSVGRNAEPSPDFHGPCDHFLGEGI